MSDIELKLRVEVGARLRAEIDVLKQECRELRESAGWWGRATARASRDLTAYRAMLIEVLASAVPHPREHPTMHAAWTKARALLAKESNNGG